MAASALSLAVALGMAFSLESFAGTDVADAAVNRVKSLMDLIDQRSPGERTEAELTKHKKDALAEREPALFPKILADVLAPPAAALAPVGIDAPVPPAELASALPPAIFLIPSATPPGGGVITPPGGGTIIPPGGGTPPPGGNTPPPGPPDTPHGPPPLPEPGTWMTMILGFGLIGWMMRRKKSAGRTRLPA